MVYMLLSQQYKDTKTWALKHWEEQSDKSQGYVVSGSWPGPFKQVSVMKNGKDGGTVLGRRS